MIVNDILGYSLCLTLNICKVHYLGIFSPLNMYTKRRPVQQLCCTVPTLYSPTLAWGTTRWPVKLEGRQFNRICNERPRCSVYTCWARSSCTKYKGGSFGGSFILSTQHALYLGSVFDQECEYLLVPLFMVEVSGFLPFWKADDNKQTALTRQFNRQGFGYPGQHLVASSAVAPSSTAARGSRTPS